MSNTDTDPTQLGQTLGPNLGDPPGWDPMKAPQARPLTSPWQNDPRFQNIGDPPQPRALPPAIGNFLGNIGAFVPPGTSPQPEQGAPPPQWPPPFTPNRRQMYVPSQANRPTTELGRPPRFPQTPDMWQVPGIYEGVGRQLGRWGGSQRTRLMAGNLSRFTNAYMQGVRNGQSEYTRMQHQRMTEAADQLQSQMQSDLQSYGAAYNNYSRDPNALHTDLMNRATQLGDTEMQAALNLGPREGERLLQWRQAKFDDLSRGNLARKQHDEQTRALNPWLLKPVGPDGLPTARLPLPKDIDPHSLSLGERARPATMPVPNDPESAAGDPTIPKSYPQNMPGPGELQGAGGEGQRGKLGQPEPFRPPPPMVWPSQPPDARDEERGGEPNEEGYPSREHPSISDRPQKIEPDTDERRQTLPPPEHKPPDKEPFTDQEMEDQEEQDKYPDQYQHRYLREKRERLKWQGQESAQADGRTRLAQADTGTMSDAGPIKLPQINVKAEGDDEGDPTDVWDRVEINRRAREARERGRQGDQPSVQPSGETKPQPPAPDQTQQRPGAEGQRGQGGPAGGPAQAPNQTIPPLGTAPETPPAKAPAPGVSPAADAARKEGQDADFIEGMGAQWAIGQQTTSGLSRSGIPGPIRDKILRRGTEIRNKMFEVINDPNIKEGDKEAVLAAIDKQNPQIGAEIRGILNGSVTPRRDSPYWVYQLAHKADPSISQTTFRSRQDTLKYHTVGKGGENRIKLGTAVGHGYDLLNELESINKPGGVSATNIWEQEWLPNIVAGKAMPDTSAAVGRITRAAETFAREYNAVMSYTGPGTMTERKEMKAELDPKNPARAIADIKKAIDELKVRNEELKHNFEVGWGGTYDAVMKNYDPAQAFPESSRGLKMIEGAPPSQGGVIDFRDLH